MIFIIRPIIVLNLKLFLNDVTVLEELEINLKT